MDSDSEKPSKQRKKNKNSCSCFSNILQPSWVRCPIPSGDDVDEIILDYGCNFLWRIGIALWAVFFVVETCKIIIK